LRAIQIRASADFPAKEKPRDDSAGIKGGAKVDDTSHALFGRFEYAPAPACLQKKSPAAGNDGAEGKLFSKR